MYRIARDDGVDARLAELRRSARLCYAEVLSALNAKPGDGRPYNTGLPDRPMHTPRRPATRSGLVWRGHPRRVRCQAPGAAHDAYRDCPLGARSRGEDQPVPMVRDGS